MQLDPVITQRDLWVAHSEIVPPEAVQLIRRAAWVRFWKGVDALLEQVETFPRRNEERLLELLAHPEIQDTHEALETKFGELLAPLGLVSQLSRLYDEEGRTR